MIPLEFVIHYFGRRGVGHTHAMLHGIKDLPRVVVLVKDRSMERGVKDVNPKAIVITPDSNSDQLRGLDATPLVVDHFALIEMFRRWFKKHDKEINDLMKENARLKSEIEELHFK